MQNAVRFGEGSMIAVLGMQTELQNLINNEKLKGVCEIANDNATGQIIISGTESVSLIQNHLKNKKIKTIPANSAPFHCSLMKLAAEMMQKNNNTSFKNSKFEIINNVNAKVENDPNKTKKLLIDQISSTVKWRESIIFMEKQ